MYFCSCEHQSNHINLQSIYIVILYNKTKLIFEYILFQINQGGKVPKELYLKNNKKITNSDDMTYVNIRKGDKLFLKYTITVPQSFLR